MTDSTEDPKSDLQQMSEIMSGMLMHNINFAATVERFANDNVTDAQTLDFVREVIKESVRSFRQANHWLQDAHASIHMAVNSEVGGNKANLELIK